MAVGSPKGPSLKRWELLLLAMKQLFRVLYVHCPALQLRQAGCAKRGKGSSEGETEPL